MSRRKWICAIAVAVIGLGTVVLATAVSDDDAMASWPYQFAAWVAHVSDWKCRYPWFWDQPEKQPGTWNPCPP